MGSRITGHFEAALQKIESARTALQITTVNLNLTGTTSIGDSHSYDSNSIQYGTSHRMEEGARNPFNQNNWNQTGVTYNETRDGESVLSMDIRREEREPDKGWLDENLSASGHVFGGDIDAMSHEGSVAGASFQNEHHQLDANVLGYETGGSATLGIGRDGINGQFSANAEAYLLNAEYEGNYGPVSAEAQVFAGAEASANVEANFNPLNGDANVDVGVDAFAGAKAEVEGGLEGQYGGASGNAGVTYGIGFEAGVDAGFEDGVVSAEVDLGATLGLGFDVGFEIEVDVKETAKDLVGRIVPGLW